MAIQHIKDLLLMAENFKISTYRTFLVLILFMLIPLALSLDEIMIDNQNDMIIYLLISIFIITILVYGLVRTNNRKIIINESGFLITEKKGYKKILWRDISHIYFSSTPFSGLHIKITFTNRKDPLIISFGKSSLWSVNFYSFRKAILRFSHKKTIIIMKSNQWLLKLI